MNVQQIYDKYVIPPNLQKHMLRVTALSEILISNWRNNTLNQKGIVFSCLFHDMANIIKFDFDKPPLFDDEKKQVHYWKNIQKDIIKKYGTNIHNATLEICREIGLSSKILSLVNNLEWSNTSKVLENQDFESAICIYCDMRIGPFGIMKLRERLTNLQTRNMSFDFEKIQKSAILLEETLQKHIKVSLNSIEDGELNDRFMNLLMIEV